MPRISVSTVFLKIRPISNFAQAPPKKCTVCPTAGGDRGGGGQMQKWARVCQDGNQIYAEREKNLHDWKKFLLKGDSTGLIARVLQDAFAGSSYRELM